MIIIKNIRLANIGMVIKKKLESKEKILIAKKIQSYLHNGGIFVDVEVTDDND